MKYGRLAEPGLIKVDSIPQCHRAAMRRRLCELSEKLPPIGLDYALGGEVVRVGCQLHVRKSLASGFDEDEAKRLLCVSIAKFPRNS